MERVFKRKSLNELRPPVDRFVAPRHSFPELRRRLLWAGREQTVDIWNQKYLQTKKYTDHLHEVFDMDPPKYRTDPRDEYSVLHWPCVPRRNRCLSSADSVLDLPSYSVAEFPDLLDWSNDNILVAALGNNYHKWSWPTQKLISEGFTRHYIHCCKFDPRGDMLILGTEKNAVELHDNLLNKLLNTNHCRCFLKYDICCSITALDWSPTGNSFITGCSRGVIATYDRDGMPINTRRVTRGALLMVRVSPDARYVAASTVNAVEVMVISWPYLELISSLNSDNWAVKALTWHPWRSALLGVGAVSSSLQARIALWDAPSNKVQETSLGSTNFSLDAMLFNHRTGELLLSLWNANPDVSYQKNCSRLVVMSDLDTVVDHWGEGRTGLDRVRKMVFSPDGTKLATATADEDLIIWNYLPEDKTKKKTNRRRFSAMPVYLDLAMQGYSLRDAQECTVFNQLFKKCTDLVPFTTI